MSTLTKCEDAGNKGRLHFLFRIESLSVLDKIEKIELFKKFKGLITLGGKKKVENVAVSVTDNEVS